MILLDIVIIICVVFIVYKIWEIRNKTLNNNNDDADIDVDDNVEDIDEDNKNNDDENIIIKAKKLFEKNNKKHHHKNHTRKHIEENIYDTSMKYIDLILKSKKQIKINPYFTETQFNNNYRDTMNAFILLVPGQKQLFNRANMPIINVSTPSIKEIAPLIKNFVREVNKILKNNVYGEFMVARDWKNFTQDQPFKSGWDKQQEKLGLPGSIYTPPSPKEPIKLIKVDHSERFETEDEIKYTLFLILQKPSVDDQMLVKVSFQIDKQNVECDRSFFKKTCDYETIVKIEEVYIMGYMTTFSFGEKSVKNEYYNFNGVTNGRIFSQNQIMKELNKKRKQYELECVL